LVHPRADLMRDPQFGADMGKGTVKLASQLSWACDDAISL
jgi:hypothetical protein